MLYNFKRDGSTLNIYLSDAKVHCNEINAKFNTKINAEFISVQKISKKYHYDKLISKKNA